MSPLKHDVVAGREHGGAAFAFRHLAAAEDPDLDHRPLGQLAEQLATEVVSAIVERDDRRAAQEHGADALLGFLLALEAVMTGQSRPVATMAMTSTR